MMKRAEVGQVYVDTDTRMGGRQLTVVEVKKQTKTKGRFKRGHVYVTCKTSAGVRVKVDEARLLSYSYRLVVRTITVDTETTPMVPIKDQLAPAPDACEAVENCGCQPAETSAAEFVAEP